MRRSLERGAGGGEGQWTHKDIKTLCYQSRQFEGTSFAVEWEGMTPPYSITGKRYRLVLRAK